MYLQEIRFSSVLRNNEQINTFV